MEDTPSETDKTLQFLGLFVVILVLAVLQAWVIQCLWSWFLVPDYEARTPSLLQCLGIRIICQLLCNKEGKADYKRINFCDLLIHAGACLFVLALGWLLHLGMQ